MIVWCSLLSVMPYRAKLYTLKRFIYCLYVLTLINQMGSPSEETLDLFRKTYFGVILPLFLSFLSELPIRFHSLGLGTDSSFFPLPESLLFVLLAQYSNPSTSLISLEFQDMLKISIKEATGRSASCFSTFGWKLLFVASQVFMNSNSFLSTVFLYLKMLCHPSLCDTSSLPFVLYSDNNTNEHFCFYCIFSVFYHCIYWWAWIIVQVYLFIILAFQFAFWKCRMDSKLVWDW